MKYLKTFESVEEPEIGDYVILRTNRDYDKLYNDFINTNVGEIVSKNGNRIEVRYSVDTFDEFTKMKNYYRYIHYDFEENEYYFSYWYSTRMISELGKTKEEVELKVSTKNYNL